jgi:hypothetical protein
MGRPPPQNSRMRQTTIASDFKLGRGLSNPVLKTLIETLNAADDANLAFFCIMPSGSILKCVSELLWRCAPVASGTVHAGGLVFVAGDTMSGRLVKIDLCDRDMLQFSCWVSAPTRDALECSALYGVFQQPRSATSSSPHTRPIGQTGPSIKSLRSGGSVRHDKRGMGQSGGL